MIRGNSAGPSNLAGGSELTMLDAALANKNTPHKND
jgi:hypothetical protein